MLDGKTIEGIEGEPIAAALLANGIQLMSYSKKYKRRGGVFCGIGQCTDCAMTVNDVPNTKTCVTPVEDGMEIKSQDGLGDD